MAALAPALAVAAELMVKVIELVAAEQAPGALVVMVNVTDPAVISAADGVYVAFRSVALSNVPVPEVVHSEVVPPPPIVPDSA
jgi:hypothetical protein